VTAIPKSATQHAPVFAHLTKTFLLLMSRCAMAGLPCVKKKVVNIIVKNMYYEKY